MTWNPNSEKHKAMHGGYKGRPTKSAVLGLLSFYSGISASSKMLNQREDIFEKTTVKKECVQLKFNF